MRYCEVKYKYADKRSQPLPPKRARERIKKHLKATKINGPQNKAFPGAYAKNESSSADTAYPLKRLLPADKDPGSFLAAARFIASDVIRILERPADVIQAL